MRKGGVERRVAELDPERAPYRDIGGDTAAQRAQGTRVAVRGVKEKHARALAGKATFQEKMDVSYHSPRAQAKAKRERGTIVKPLREAVADARGRRRTARDVRLNPLSGKFTTVNNFRRIGEVNDPDVGEGAGFSRRPRSMASAARAKARKAPVKKPEYVGRRRRES